MDARRDGLEECWQAKFLIWRWLKWRRMPLFDRVDRLHIVAPVHKNCGTARGPQPLAINDGMPRVGTISTRSNPTLRRCVASHMARFRTSPVCCG